MLIDPHVGTIIWTIVTFLVVLVILKATVWKPLLAALDEREKRISDALESAEAARAEAQSALNEHQEKLNLAEAEAREIVQQSREDAEKVHQEILENGIIPFNQLKKQILSLSWTRLASVSFLGIRLI